MWRAEVVVHPRRREGEREGLARDQGRPNRTRPSRWWRCARQDRRLVQVTDSPATIVIVGGENAKSAISTAWVPPACDGKQLRCRPRAARLRRPPPSAPPAIERPSRMDLVLVGSRLASAILSDDVGRGVDNSAQRFRIRGQMGLSPGCLIGHAWGVPKGQLAIRDHLNDRRGSFGIYLVRRRRRALDPRSRAC